MLADRELDNPTNAASNGNNGAGAAASKVTAKSLAAVGGIQKSNNWDVDHYNPYSPPWIDDLYKQILPSHIPANDVEVHDKTSRSLSGDESTASARHDKAGDVMLHQQRRSRTVERAGLTVTGKVKLGIGDLHHQRRRPDDELDGSELKCIELHDRHDQPQRSQRTTGNVKLTGGTVDISAPDGAGDT